jgi:hypothetical protein
MALALQATLKHFEVAVNFFRIRILDLDECLKT